MAKKREKKEWIQGVVKKMEKSGTKGAFTEYCGGKVTNDCIERGLKSKDPKIRARARLAKAFRKISKKEGGEISESTVDYLTGLKAGFINSLSDAALTNLVQNVEEAFRKNRVYDNINTFVGELLTRRYGGNIKKYQEGGMSETQMLPQQEQTEQQMAAQQESMGDQQAQQQPTDITYEQYVQFILSYPEYLDRFLKDVEMAKQQLSEQERGMQDSSLVSQGQQGMEQASPVE